ncbi:hypothetical protein Tco_0532059 [Tanacetum coccineum]
MDDEPMWAADHVVAPTPGSAITIPETTNEFAIKGNHLTLVKGNQFDGRTKTDPQQTTFMNSSESCDKFNTETPKMKPMDAMTLKMDAQYKELQSNAKKTKPDLDEDDIPMSREEEKKIVKFPSFWDDHFFTTADAIITSKQNNSILVWNALMIFNIDSAIKYSYSNDDTCFSIDVIDEILEEDFDALLNEGSNILHSIKGTILEKEIFTEFDEFMAMTADENSDSESDTEEPPFEKITINTSYKIKTSLEEPPTDLELKPLPGNL